MLRKLLQTLSFTLCYLVSAAALAGGPVEIVTLEADVDDNPGSTFDVTVSWDVTGEPNSCVYLLYVQNGSGWDLIDSGSVHWVGSESTTLNDAQHQLHLLCEGNDDIYVDEEYLYFSHNS